MRAVVQRVSRSRVTVDGEVTGEIGKGLLVLLGISVDDDTKDAVYILDKVIHLRIFEDAQGKMNRSLVEIEGEMLVVSQFTLYGDSRRGRRPSFIEAANGPEARFLYEHFVSSARSMIRNVGTGRFGAMMDVELVNDGPVTILLDSNKIF